MGLQHQLLGSLLAGLGWSLLLVLLVLVLAPRVAVRRLFRCITVVLLESDEVVEGLRDPRDFRLWLDQRAGCFLGLCCTSR